MIWTAFFWEGATLTLHLVMEYLSFLKDHKDFNTESNRIFINSNYNIKAFSHILSYYNIF